MINVRRATIDDLESIVAVYTAAWRKGFADMFSAATFMRDDFDEDRHLEVQGALLDETISTSVVEIDTRVAGFSGVSIDEGRPCVDDLWMHPTAWGRGVASHLLTSVEDQHRSLGIELMTSWVPEDSPRARRVFDKTGWAPTGAVEGFGIYEHEPNKLLEYHRRLY